jgi:microcystin-dependent protein
MSDPFVGEIKMFAGNFAPRGWALCDGQLLSIAQNQSLFSLLGTTYGGDGRVTFGLPDLRGRFPMHRSATHFLGQKSGAETVSLSAGQLPAHNHALRCSGGRANATSPAGNVLAASAAGDRQYSGQSSPTGAMHADAIGPSGGSQGHNNLPPYQCIQFIIALTGVFPPRN